MQLAPDEQPLSLAFDLSQSTEGPLQIEWAELIHTLVSERRQGISTASLAAGFICAISNLIVALAEHFPGYPVALGGRRLSKPGADGPACSRARSSRSAGIDQRNPAAQ